MMDITDPTFNEYGTIDCMAAHPKLGLIPMTISANDSETAHLYAQVSGVAIAYVDRDEDVTT